MLLGRVFDDRYKLTERIGTGGMAVVYRANDLVLNRVVAVKVMLDQYAMDDEFTQRFRQEAAAAANLSSPYIVNIYDWGQDQGTYYIVMEYVRGSDLKSGIQARGVINQRKAAEIASEVCQALTVAHNQDIIHSDIKPQNIMVQPDGNIKVMDFGIAKAKNSLEEPSDSVLGTAHYISPEQAQGKELAATSDIYSLGVVLYECVTGRVPFDGPDAVTVAIMQVKNEPIPPRQVNAAVDEGLESIILRAMQKDPARRYQSAAIMREALQAWLAGTPIDCNGNPVAADAAPTVVLPAASRARSGYAGSHASGLDTDSSYLSAARTTVLPDNYFDSATTQSAVRAAGTGTPGTPVTASQAAARARIAARNRQAAMGGAQPAMTGSVRAVNAEEPRYEKTPRKFKGVVIAIALVVVIVAVVLFFTQCGSTVLAPDTVPNVVGTSQTSAVKALKSAGYEVGDITKEYSDDVASGYVISCDPAAGTQLDPGGTVNLVVSQGKEMVTVPTITGKTVTELQQLLEAAGLEAKAGEAQYSATVDTNLVISQDPIPGAKVEKGSTVTYVLSLGIESVTVPNVTGYSVSQARNTLIAQGFTVFEQHEYSSEVEKDTVIRQSPSADSLMEKNGGVTIVVSDGIELVDVPDVLGLSMPDATAKLLAAGLSVNKTGDTGSDATVIGQNPEPTSATGTQAEKGSVVTIQGKAPDPEPEPEPEPEPSPDPGTGGNTGDNTGGNSSGGTSSGSGTSGTSTSTTTS